MRNITMRKFNALKGMNDIMLAMNNEEVIDAWWYSMPDGADDSDIMDIVEADSDLFAEIVNEFFRLVILGGADGLYFGECDGWNSSVYGEEGHAEGARSLAQAGE